MGQHEIRTKIENEAKSFFNPVYSLFTVDSFGRYTLLIKTGSLDKLLEQWEAELRCANLRGLEIRVNGVRVDLG